MIFKKLSLKNFMSYSDSEIDFTGIHTACLSGENGVGKSSLLDSITWIIWDEGRANADELVKLGTNNMSCELEFYMEDDIYRIYRSRVKGKKNSQGKSNLEFQIYNPKERNWISLSRHTVKQTQELINKTLKMDYETFVNSVYLKQGRADEFTLKKPSERKQVLAEILGLSFYDELCERARIKIRDIEKSVSVALSHISDLVEKNKLEEEYIIKLAFTKDKLRIEEEKLQAVKISLYEKEKEFQVKTEKQNQVSTLEKSKVSHMLLIEALNDQILNNKQKIEMCEKLISTQDQIQHEYDNYLKARQEFEILEKDKENHAALNDKKNALDYTLKEKISEIEKNLAIIKSRQSDKKNIKAELEKKLLLEKNFYDKVLPFADEKIEEYKLLKENFNIIESSGLELRHQKEILELEQKELLRSSGEMQGKLSLLKAGSNVEQCPLCKSTIQDKESVILEYENEIVVCQNKIEEINKRIAEKDVHIKLKREEYIAIKDKIKNYTDAIKELLRNLKTYNSKISINNSMDADSGIMDLSSSIEILKAEFMEAKNQVSVLDDEMSKMDDEMVFVKTLLTEGDDIKNISQNILEINKSISSLNYDSQKYDLLKLRLKSGEASLVALSSLKNAQAQYDSLKKENINLEANLEKGRAEIVSFEALISNIKNEIININEIQFELNLFKNEFQIQEKLVSQIKEEKIYIEKNLQDIALNKDLLKNKQKAIEEFLIDKGYYESLERAFGKNGIQVAIIETVVPEIENEANRILSQLTDNQMHVALRTQKEKKTGGIQETLDVIIADNQGSRSYELYSGGEAFKINFALRLAMSRLLARRAGAKLQTLIVDEGFGSQDASGRERLVEIIKSIQGEFELILIVTHLDELKDSFSTLIQVTKDEEGSKLSIAA